MIILKNTEIRLELDFFTKNKTEEGKVKEVAIEGGYATQEA